MHLLPKRPSLVNEVADVIRQGIREKRWVDHLPGERSLCRQLGVSRRSLQKSFALLDREKLFEPGRGRRRRIAAMPSRVGPSGLPPVIAVLTSMTVHQRGSGFLLSRLYELWEHAHDLGLSIQLHSAARFMITQPGPRLEVLLRESPARCWLMSAMPEPAQRWFRDRDLPVVLVGHCYPGIELPAVDVDFRAICRHAVGVFARLGHRRIAFLMDRGKFAGDIASEKGFRDGFESNQLDPAGAIIAEHDGTNEDIVRAIQVLVNRHPRPTALLTMVPEYAITVATHLIQSGLRIPQDISLICRDEDNHLHRVIPQIACYESLHERIGRRLFQLIGHIVESGHAPPRQVLLMPELKPGHSLAPPAQA